MNKKVLGFLMALVFLLSGCVFQDEVATNQKGVLLYKNGIQNVVGSGVYTQWFCVYCDLKVTNVDTLTFTVEDPEVLTKDNQAVEVKITIQARRKADDASVKNIFTNWSSLASDEALISTISSTAREGLKVGVRKFTLTQLLDERSGGTTGLGLAQEILTAIQADADNYSAELINITVENIGPSKEYMAILAQTANLNAEIDKAKREQELINQKALNSVLEQEKRVEIANAQVLAEQAQTEVLVEIAERQNEVTAAQNKVYETNAQAFELERLRLLKEVLGDKSVIYYLPSDATLTLLQNVGNITPLPVVSGQ